MLISLHKQATTTPKIRAAIQASDEPAWLVAERYGISEQTVWKWRKRDSVQDRSHTPHRLQTTLTPAQEAVAVVLREALLLPLDDLLSVVREFLNPNVSRSGLDRCLRRHGVGNLRDLKPRAERPAHKPFKAYEPGYLHIDVKYLPQMADEERRRYLFVAIDRATRWVFVRIYPAKTAANARRFLRDLERAAPMKITKVLTDNGKEFTDRLFGLRRRAATGNHDFDRLCAELDIEHRLTPPMRPQTNGLVERFNGRIEDVLQSHHFRSGEDLEQTILRYVRLYNGQLPQSVLKGRTPINALKDWQRQKPELFRKRVYNHTGCDTYIIGHRNGIKPRSETYLNAFKQDFRLLDLHAVMRAANAIETLIGRPAAKFRARAAETADTGQVRVVQATAGTEPQPVSPTVGGAIRTAMDAELMAIAANMAEICIKTGTRQFRDLVRAMVAICGFPFSTIQPYARTAYNQLRDDLELSGESVEGIDDARAVMAAIKAIRAEEDLRPPKMEAAPAAPSTQSRDTPPTNCNPQESAERGWAGPETGQENNVEPPSGGEDEWPNAEGTRDRDSNRPSSPAFDHETYAKAKPMFIEAARKFGQAGQDILDIMKSVIRAMVERFGVDAAAPVVRSMRPYIKQFAADVRDGVINPWEAPEVDNDGVPDQASDQGRLAPGDEMGSGSDRGGRDGEDSGSNEGDRDEAGDGDQPVGSVGGGSGALKEQLSDACVLSNAGVFGGSIEAASDVGDALFGLGAKARLGIGPSFNEEAYAKAKPLFRAAVLQFAEAGQDIKDMVTALVRGLNSMGIDEEARKNMRPFLRQYVIDLNSGAEKPFADQQEVEKNEGEPDQGSDQGRPAPAAQRGIGKVRDWVAKASSR